MSPLLRTIVLSAWLAAGHIGVAAGQASGPVLNPQVQADLLNRQVVEAYGTGSSSEVLGLIDQYRMLQAKGVKIPPAILLVEAKAAASMQDSERALRALGEYLNAASKGDAGYEEALALYPRYQEADVERINRQRRNPTAATVVKAIKSDDVASLKQFLEAGWTPAQALQPDAETKALGLAVTTPIYPIEVAFRMDAMDAASLLAPLSNTQGLSLQGPDRTPAWTRLPTLFERKKWSASNPDHRRQTTTLLSAILRSNTPRVHGEDSVIWAVYNRMPLTPSDRLQLYREGLLTAQDVSGKIGAQILISVAQRFGYFAKTSETDAMAELRKLIELGADVASIGNTAESLATFLGGQHCHNPDYCGGLLSLLDPRAAATIFGSGWAPRSQDVDAFWQVALLSNSDYTTARCAIDTDMVLLVLPSTAIGKGFTTLSASDAADAIALITMPQLRPSQDTIRKLRAKVDRYRRGYAGKDKCYGTCRSAPETWCGAILNSLDTRS